MTDRKTNTTPKTGLEIALAWSKLPAEHLAVALNALEPQLAREAALEQTRERHKFIMHMTGVISGFAIALCSLISAIVAGFHHEQWLAGLLVGPSVLSLATLFVTREQVRLPRTAIPKMDEQGKSKAAA